jgi:hypothetical protein
MNDFQSEYLGEFKITEKDKYLHHLAKEYNLRCESYDRKVCTGQIGRDGIVPATREEMGIISRHARQVMKELTQRAERKHGLEPKLVSEYIRKAENEKR